MTKKKDLIEKIKEGGVAASVDERKVHRQLKPLDTSWQIESLCDRRVIVGELWRYSLFGDDTFSVAGLRRLPHKCPVCEGALYLVQEQHRTIYVGKNEQIYEQIVDVGCVGCCCLVCGYAHSFNSGQYYWESL